MEKMMTREEAVAFWAEYDRLKASAREQDLQTAIAQRGMADKRKVFPNFEIAFERHFWENVYTPELARSLPEIYRYAD